MVLRGGSSQGVHLYACARRALRGDLDGSDRKLQARGASSILSRWTASSWHGGLDRCSRCSPGAKDLGGVRYLQRRRFPVGQCLLVGRRRCPGPRGHSFWGQGRRVAESNGGGYLRRAPRVRGCCGRRILALRCRAGARHPASSGPAGGGASHRKGRASEAPRRPVSRPWSSSFRSLWACSASPR